MDHGTYCKKALVACLLSIEKLHAADLVHTDIRSENIMWQGPTTAMLSEFKSIHQAGFEAGNGPSGLLV